MALIDNADQAHKMNSVRLAVALAAFDAAVGFLPQLEGMFTANQFILINGAVAVLIAVARVLKQEGVS